jgi:hypothetical protein
MWPSLKEAEQARKVSEGKGEDMEGEGRGGDDSEVREVR